MDSDDRPYVILNVAVTADGKTDTVARQGATISSAQDAERVDRLRAASDAIMVGGRTLLGDDPRLVVKAEALRAERRARGVPENPIKVGVITRANLKLDSRFLTVGPAQIMIFTTHQTDQAQIDKLREYGVQVTVTSEQRIDLRAVLAALKRAGVHRLLVEGGGTLNAELLRLELVDEIYLYMAPLIFSGATAPTLADGVGWSRVDATHLELRGVDLLPDHGILVHYLVAKR